MEMLNIIFTDFRKYDDLQKRMVAFINERMPSIASSVKAAKREFGISDIAVTFDDLKQEVLRRIFESSSFKKNAIVDVDDFVFIIARNTCFELSGRSMKRREKEEVFLQTDLANREEPDQATDVISEMKFELKNYIELVLTDKVSEPEYSAFKLYHYDGFDDKEIARILDITKEYAKVLRYKVMKVLDKDQKLVRFVSEYKGYRRAALKQRGKKIRTIH